jgi:ankyrin repeat protein
MIHKYCFIVGLVFVISLHGMNEWFSRDEGFKQRVAFLYEELDAGQNHIDIVEYNSSYGPYNAFHSELMDLCHAPLASFDKKRFDFLVENPRMNANYADNRRGLKEGVTLLGAACAKANIHVIASLLQKTADPNVKTSAHTLPIFAVMASKTAVETQISCLDLLKSYGASFTLPFDGMDTPLHRVANQYPHCVPYLLKNSGTLVNARGNCGRTPLMCALEGFRNNPHVSDAVNELIKHNADISMNDDFGTSVLQYLERYNKSCDAYCKYAHSCLIYGIATHCATIDINKKF